MLWKPAALALCLSFVALAPVTAGSDEVNRVAQRSASEARVPSRGMTMKQVEQRFGTPTQRRAAVGDPPITRWEYSGFIVYFEYQRVIHSVRKR